MRNWTLYHGVYHAAVKTDQIHAACCKSWGGNKLVLLRKNKLRNGPILLSPTLCLFSKSKFNYRLAIILDAEE
jgi:hypothetical protein